MNVVIVDDEQHCIDHLTALLKPHMNDLNIRCFMNVQDAIYGLQTNNTDVLFLDVQLNTQTGFDVLTSLRKHDFSLIFTTAYEKYALQAISFSAIAYLLKPIDRDEFEIAFKRAMKHMENRNLSERIHVLLTHISSDFSPKRISIPHLDGYTFLQIDDIIRCEADINYTHLFLINGKKITASRTLKHFEKLLESHHFFRIHNSHLVNLKYISAYHKDGYAVLMDGTKLHVSTRRKDAFLIACNEM